MSSNSQNLQSIGLKATFPRLKILDLFQKVENLETREGCLEADTLEVLRIAAGHGGPEKLDLRAGSPASPI